MRLYVIEEITPAGAKLLQRQEFGRVVTWENKDKAKTWLKVLDEARGQKSTPLPYFGKSKFKIIELREVKR